MSIPSKPEQKSSYWEEKSATITVRTTAKCHRKFLGRGLRTFCWRLNERIIVCSVSKERRRVVDLYSTTSMTTAQVVEHLGYPTRQCLGHWLAKDPRYAGHMANFIIPLGTKNEGDRTGAERSATEAGRRTTRRERQCGPRLGQGVPRGRHGRTACVR